MNKEMEDLKERLTSLTRDLVDIPTENNPPDGDEAAAQAYVEKLLGGMGFRLDVFSPVEISGFEQNPAFLHGRNLNLRKDVVGVWKGSGGGKSVVLSGHMDVAPREPLPWKECEPFRSVVKNGRIYGRGSCDMKGGFACAAAAVELLRESGFTPRGDVIVESVVDEEYASGNGTIASRFRGYNADFAVVLEPSGLRICPANVGGVMVRIEISGQAGMPYTGEKTFNIAYALGHMLRLLEELERKREEAECPPLWHSALQKRKMVVTKVKAGEVKPHGQLGAPIDAWVEVSVQTYPGETPQTVLKELNDFIRPRFKSSAVLRITPLYHYVEPADTPPEHPGVRKIAECAKKYIPEVQISCAPFPCDLFAFQKYGGTPGVIFGPIGGNLHGPDEWVDIESMKNVTLALADFIRLWCGQNESYSYGFGIEAGLNKKENKEESIDEKICSDPDRGFNGCSSSGSLFNPG